MRFKTTLFILLVSVALQGISHASEKIIILLNGVLTHDDSGMPPSDGDFAGLDGAQITWIGVADRDAAPSYSNNLNVDRFGVNNLRCTITGGSNFNGTYTPYSQRIGEEVGNIAFPHIELSTEIMLNHIVLEMPSGFTGAIGPTNTLTCFNTSDVESIRSVSTFRMEDGASGYYTLACTNMFITSPAGANLRGINLSGYDFSDTDFSGANLSSVNLAGANLGAVNLTLVVSGNIAGTPSALPDGWQLIQGYLVGPGADLSGADFSGANLSSVNLAGADLSSVNLAGANLGGANLGAANLTLVVSGNIAGTPSALPDGWQLIPGVSGRPGS